MSAPIRRKVLCREDFGLCVCLPKTHWQKVAAPGEETTVRIGDEELCVTVHSEPCNCRGTGWHEHRFLGFAEGVRLKPGDVAVLSFDEE